MDNVRITADYTGMEPVFYTLTDDGIRISSDITELIRLKGEHAAINKDALKMYLVFQYVPTVETIVKGIYRLPPGSTLTWSDEAGLKIEHVPHRMFSPGTDDFKSATEITRKAVEVSVQEARPDEDTIGCFLSGGVDSSYLAALLKPEITFTFAFEGPEFDESLQARELSGQLGAQNFRRYITSEEYLETISEVQAAFGQPYANLTGASVYCIAKLAAEHVKTVFSGEGPDELFGGYSRYRVGTRERSYRKLPLCLRKLAAHLFQNCGNRRLTAFLTECASDVEEHYIGQSDIMTDEEANRVLRPDYRSDITHTDITHPIFKESSGGSDLDKKQYLDLCLWGPFDNNLSLSLICRHFGLHVVTPFMDERVMRAALSLKDEFRVNGMRTKAVFREAAASCLPRETCERPKKGMPLPYGSWFKSELYLDRFRESFSKPDAGMFFDTDILMKLVEDYRSGRENNAKKLFAVYCFLVWYREVFLKNTAKCK